VEIVMIASSHVSNDFTPVAGLLGGLLIGCASVLFLWANGRIAGISGIFGGLLTPTRGDRAWRLMFLGGLLLGAIAWPLVTGKPVPFHMPAGNVRVLVAGILVGFGTRMAGGCTSGHGVCGIARGARRSLVATLVFMVSGVLTVLITRYAGGN
jgi:uncharacterized membrane protein YedE/YeeE